ncbi:MAG TPA: PaaI family thioesterase [Solirubrobacteraceae bacterium]|nr:PaaI family thioesterase [Solirubrobacteraceae bacterium]
MAAGAPAARGHNDAITVAASKAALAGTFPGYLGIELIEISGALVRGRMAVDRRHLHPGGYVHGGCWVAFADTVAAWGTMRNLPPERGFTTAELKMNVLGAGRSGDLLEGIGELLHAGSRTQVWEVRVYKIGSGQAEAQPAAAGAQERAPGPPKRPADGRLVANFICTQMVL